MSSVNVFLIDSQKLLREGIKSLLRNTSFHIVDESGDLREAVVKLESGLVVDLILLELPDEGENGWELLQAVHRTAPTAKLVVLTMGLDGWVLANAGSLGICGLLQKDISPNALLRSLELVMLGEKVFPIHSTFLPAVQEHVRRPGKTEEAGRGGQSGELADLSSREFEILRQLMNGLPNKVIARELNLAETTVKAHVKTILRKIKAGNRTQAAIWCLTNGIEGSLPASTERQSASFAVDNSEQAA